MNFEIVDIKDIAEKEEIEKEKEVKFTLISLDKDCFKNIKRNINDVEAFEIDADAINLQAKLYSDEGKNASIELQKKNCEKIVALYKVCVKVVKLLKHKKLHFSRRFYVKNLDKKINNNDFMLASMLNVRFNVSPFKRISAMYKYAADYLDMENSLNKMCDFRDNKCTKHRDLNDGRTTGCCTKTICKYTCNAPCPTWNLACKLIMCDYLINKKGYYFSPHYNPIMRVNLTPIERTFSIGQLCCSSKKAIRELWIVRLFTGLVGLFLIGVIALLAIV